MCPCGGLLSFHKLWAEPRVPGNCTSHEVPYNFSLVLQQLVPICSQWNVGLMWEAVGDQGPLYYAVEHPGYSDYYLDES